MICWTSLLGGDGLAGRMCRAIQSPTICCACRDLGLGHLPIDSSYLLILRRVH